MLTIPVTINNSRTHFDLIIILEDENIERIKARDPAEVDLSKFPMAFQGLKLRTVQICYLTPQESAALQDGTMPHSEVMGRLYKGWEFKPELGDSDKNYNIVVPRN